MPYSYYGFDATYLLVLIAMAIVGWAQFKVKSTFNKYDQLMTEHQVTGRQAAEFILQQSGITNVRVEPVAGHLTDHYDPRNKVLRLSEATYQNTSVSAVAVAAHECGHALQDAQDYKFMRVRAALVPVVNLGSTIAMPLILIGFLMQIAGLIQLGILAFSLVLLFQLVTLPVEFDASRRAIEILGQGHIFTEAEVQPARKVLRAAGFTYVAASLSTLFQIVRFILLSNRSNRN
ncbi:peptidase [Falseniella ignava]|uniref:Peptidase n=2 Tax=Falseniella ignava TaxID=137730 RepID=A0A2I1K1Z3_9LACT|nr:peptidase [Falseniella ignava]